MLKELNKEIDLISNNLELIQNGSETEVLASNESYSTWLENNLLRALKILQEVASFAKLESKKTKKMVEDAFDWSERQTSTVKSIMNQGFADVIGGNEDYETWAEYELELAIKLIKDFR